MIIGSCNYSQNVCNNYIGQEVDLSWDEEVLTVYLPEETHHFSGVLSESFKHTFFSGREVEFGYQSEYDWYLEMPGVGLYGDGAGEYSQVVGVPTPGPLALMAVGLLAIFGARWIRQVKHG